jgi:hypothetical protein
MLPEPARVLRAVVHVFEELNIPYFIGGSVASSMLGSYRSTMDIDCVADLKEDDVASFVEAVQDEFYVDADMIREAIQTHSSFNIVHLPTMVKVDVFILEPNGWATQEWARRRLMRIPSGSEETSVFIASPEDMILQKLAWYRMGGGVSERQWSDVQGILQTQANQLDYPYLERWARELGLPDQLKIAYAEAGITVPSEDVDSSLADQGG